jgi:hypothetical protein
MDNSISFRIEHSYIDDDGCVVAHLYNSESEYSLNLKIIQSEKNRNYGLVNFVDINNRKVLNYQLIISVDEKNFSNYKIMFLMGLIWRLKLKFENDLSIYDFFSIDDECEVSISNFSFSYQSTYKSLRETSIDLGGFKTQIPKILQDIKALKDLVYILIGIFVLMFFLNYLIER